MKLFATVTKVNPLPASTAANGSAIPAAVSYQLAVKSGSKLAAAALYWLTLPDEGANNMPVGHKEELDSEQFYATEVVTNNGQTIKVLKSRALELI